MLLKFYILSCLILVIPFVFGLLKHKKEILTRTITLFALLHIVCLALYGGETIFTGFIIILLSIAVFELAATYNIYPWLIAAVNLPIIMLIIPHIDFPGYVALFFLLISFSAFVLNKKIISGRLYFFLFYFAVLIPCSISLIGIYKLRAQVIIMLLLLLQFNDSFGFIFGKKFGKRRIFPTISPNKTLEGYFFGLLGIILGICALHTVVPILKGNGLYSDILLMGYIFLFGNAGDLLFSVIKRKLEIKDFSSILPGHGGILDRFDSIFFVSPVLFLLIKQKIV
jgi:phosphatidate cytidylyltransferase